MLGEHLKEMGMDESAATHSAPTTRTARGARCRPVQKQTAHAHQSQRQNESMNTHICCEDAWRTLEGDGHGRERSDPQRTNNSHGSWRTLPTCAEANSTRASVTAAE